MVAGNMSGGCWWTEENARYTLAIGELTTIQNWHFIQKNIFYISVYYHDNYTNGQKCKYY